MRCTPLHRLPTPCLQALWPCQALRRRRRQSLRLRLLHPPRSNQQRRLPHQLRLPRLCHLRSSLCRQHQPLRRSKWQRLQCRQ